MLLLTLRGTPTIYCGDEIGMEDGKVPPERERDPVGRLLDSGKFGRDPGADADAVDAASRARGSRRASRGCRSRRTPGR